MTRPRWTVLYNIVSPESNKWIGKGYEFFDKKEDAEKAYLRVRGEGKCGTKRPYHSVDDKFLHMVPAPKKEESMKMNEDKGTQKVVIPQEVYNLKETEIEEYKARIPKENKSKKVREQGDNLRYYSVSERSFVDEENCPFGLPHIDLRAENIEFWKVMTLISEENFNFYDFEAQLKSGEWVSGDFCDSPIRGISVLNFRFIWDKKEE